MIVILILFSSASLGIDTVNEVKPKITANFQENVVIISSFLENTDTGEVFSCDVISSQADKTFIFAPAKALSNGIYKFTLYASDLVGNPSYYFYNFEVSVPETDIVLVEPNSIGVSNSTTFRVVIHTSRPSVCRYTGVEVSSFDDIRMKYFDVTGNVSESIYVLDHTLNSFSVEPEFPKLFFVRCMDDLGRDNPKSFTLYSDVVYPTLNSVIFVPSPVVEYPPAGDIYSVLKVAASEPVLCKYTKDENASYESMTVFAGYDIDNFDAYDSAVEQKIMFQVIL